MLAALKNQGKIKVTLVQSQFVRTRRSQRLMKPPSTGREGHHQARERVEKSRLHPISPLLKVSVVQLCDDIHSHIKRAPTLIHYSNSGTLTFELLELIPGGASNDPRNHNPCKRSLRVRTRMNGFVIWTPRKFSLFAMNNWCDRQTLLPPCQGACVRSHN
ncbi:hypothetical protein CDAR_437571 [Caerostris darwini]|uniref:Uncharacterized protein n=1 Tax=Caerostris darwini TaxID=1538125 RepID=A0AAV4NT85_9ARAC|nr:hypothetical protein CDAR_437571 [Caerostris darwini]